MSTIHPALANAATFSDFQSAARQAGFDEAMVRTWQPRQIVEDHSHPFDAEALVVDGEMWLGDAEGTRHLTAGDTFNLARGTVHSERYGPDGATYWVARRAG